MLLLGGVATGAVIWSIIDSMHVPEWWSADTYGEIRIDTPQVYTRERLVNDRFREQAWLERQLESLTDNQAVLASYERNLTLLDAAVGLKADLDAEKTTAILKQFDEMQKGDGKGPLFPDQFQKMQRYREAIRRSLIENDLDDRHDLRSNSLFLFKFGATIAPGTTTRSPVLIDLTLDETGTVKPMNRLVQKEQFEPCAGLYEFECAFLSKTGRIPASIGDGTPIGNEKERDYLRRISDGYDKWANLYAAWIRQETNGVRSSRDAFENLTRSAAGLENADSLISQLVKDSFESWLEKLQMALIGALTRINGTSPGAFTCDRAVAKDSSYKAHVDLTIRSCFEKFKAKLTAIPEERANTIVGEVSLFDTQIKGEEKVDVATRLPEKIAELLSFGSCRLPGFSLSARDAADGGKKVFQLEFTDEADNALLGCALDQIRVEHSKYLLNDNPISQAELSDAAAPTDEYSYYPGGNLEDYVDVQDYGRVFSRIDLAYYILPLVVPGCVKNANYYDSFRKLKDVATYSMPRTANTFDGYVQSQVDQWRSITNLYCSSPVSEATFTKAGFGLYQPLIQTDGEIRNNPYDRIVLSKRFVRLLALGGEKRGFNAPMDRSRPNETSPAKDIGEFVRVPVSLFSFIARLSEKQSTFSYSVSPRADFDLTAVSTASGSGISGGLADQLMGAGGELKFQQLASRSEIRKNHTVLGFGTEAEVKVDESGYRGRKAQFGWYILPNREQRWFHSVDRMKPRNESLSALVSVPAWWGSVKISGRADWLGRDYKPVPGASRDIEITLDLPVRLELIRNLLVDFASSPPVVDRLQLGSIRLTACQGAQVRVPGQRLWRSTVVTIGPQKSRLIQVMPDMEGIIAEFDKLKPPAVQGDTQKPIRLPLTVWTSQGHVIIHDAVELVVPQSVIDSQKKGDEPCPQNSAPSKT